MSAAAALPGWYQDVAPADGRFFRQPAGSKKHTVPLLPPLPPAGDVLGYRRAEGERETPSRSALLDSHKYHRWGGHTTVDVRRARYRDADDKDNDQDDEGKSKEGPSPRRPARTTAPASASGYCLPLARKTLSTWRTLHAAPSPCPWPV